MSTPEEKKRNATRRHRDEVAVKKQLKIAKGAYYIGDPNDMSFIKQPHRLSKHHAMNCGNPNCVMCGNPRKMFKELTTQEKRMYQDVDNMRNTHGNGLTPTQD